MRRLYKLAHGRDYKYMPTPWANGIHIFLEIVLLPKTRNSLIFGLYF